MRAIGPPESTDEMTPLLPYALDSARLPGVTPWPAEVPGRHRAAGRRGVIVDPPLQPPEEPIASRARRRVMLAVVAAAVVILAAAMSLDTASPPPPTAEQAATPSETSPPPATSSPGPDSIEVGGVDSLRAAMDRLYAGRASGQVPDRLQSSVPSDQSCDLAYAGSRPVR